MYIISCSKLRYNQKCNLIIVMFVCLIFIIGMITSTTDYMFFEILFALILLISITLMFVKKGIIIEGNKIEIGNFLFGIIISKSNNKAFGYSKITMLKFKTKIYDYDNKDFSKGSRVRWEPYLNYDNYVYELHLINDNHTKKSNLINFENEELSTKTLDFIINNTSLNYEKYNPNFSNQ